MDGLHPVMAAAIATFRPAPRALAINDDDIYVVDLITRRVLRRHGASSGYAQAARVEGLPVIPGYAVLRGMQLRGLVDELGLEFLS